MISQGGVTLSSQCERQAGRQAGRQTDKKEVAKTTRPNTIQGNANSRQQTKREKDLIQPTEFCQRSVASFLSFFSFLLSVFRSFFHLPLSARILSLSLSLPSPKNVPTLLLSVCLSICLSVCLSVRNERKQVSRMQLTIREINQERKYECQK